ncbi:MAG: CbiX/SirB N-terminal domain-containing protein [Phycisphaeraceae bacterium]
MTETHDNQDQTGVIIVDHGSSRPESNRMLEQFIEQFRQHSTYAIIEPAHMELAEPTIATAFNRCVERGARRVAVIPYFLLPGKHWDQDIPQLTEAAASKHPGIPFLVGAPIGLHPMMQQVIQARLDHCLAHAAGQAPECESCQGTGRCVMKVADTLQTRSS